MRFMSMLPEIKPYEVSNNERIDEGTFSSSAPVCRYRGNGVLGRPERAEQPPSGRRVLWTWVQQRSEGPEQRRRSVTAG
jgi:hypothetical protein